VPTTSRQQAQAEPPSPASAPRETRVSQWTAAWRAGWARNREARQLRRERKAIQKQEIQERARRLREEAQSDSGLVASLYGQAETGRGKPLVRPVARSQSPPFERAPIIGRSASAEGAGEPATAGGPAGVFQADSATSLIDTDEVSGTPVRTLAAEPPP